MVTKIFRASLLLAALALGAPAALGQSAAQPPPPPPKPLPPKPPDTGRLDGANYVNDFFGLSLAVPQDWVVIDGAQRGAMVEASKQMLKTEDARSRRQIDDSIQRSIILLGLTKLPIGSAAGPNASFMVIAERVIPGVKDGADVIRSMEAGFKMTQLKVERQGPIRTERAGAADFAVAAFKTTAPQGAVFMQKFYVTVKKGYALQLVYTYLDEADVPAFETMIRSLAVR